MTHIPYREYREFALGVLHWTPDVFERCTLWDIQDAMEGHVAANKPPEDEKIYPTREELEELKRMHPDA